MRGVWLPFLFFVSRALADDVLVLDVTSTEFSEGKAAIRIKLRADYSDSPTFVKNLAAVLQEDQTNAIDTHENGKNSLYRAETWGVLQGTMSHSRVPEVVSKGPCPANVDGEAIYAKRKCFPHDPHCGCHGPLFEQGMVGWAGGRGGGPDFFIYAGKGPAAHWSHDHTIWGELADFESLETVKKILAFKTDSSTGMQMLLNKIPFALKVVDSEKAAAHANQDAAADANKLLRGPESAAAQGAPPTAALNITAPTVARGESDLILVFMGIVVILMVVVDCAFRATKKKKYVV